MREDRHQAKRECGAKCASLKPGSVWSREEGLFDPGSTFGDVAPLNHGCPAFEPGVLLCGHSHPFSHRSGPHDRFTIIAATGAWRKALRFVLSSRKARNRSCFRVEMLLPFVLSSRNSTASFVLSSRNRAPSPLRRISIGRPAGRGQGRSGTGGQTASAGSSIAIRARWVMMTRALAGLRPALRGPCPASWSAAASSISRMA